MGEEVRLDLYGDSKRAGMERGRVEVAFEPAQGMLGLSKDTFAALWSIVRKQEQFPSGEEGP